MIPVILSAVRTPIGAFGGYFKNLTAAELGQVAIAEALRRARVSPEEVNEVYMGNVVQAGQGQNPARQAARGAGIPDHVPATTVNMVCGSGLKAVALAAQAVRVGDGDIFVAGGMESMSRAPYLLPSARWGARMGSVMMLDAMLCDGLLDAFTQQHMGDIAERWAERYGITREEQDAFALRSQQQCAAAVAAGLFNAEIVPVEVKGDNERRRQDVGATTLVRFDEHPRPDTTLERLSQLKPAFRPDGTITAGNASGINDGAAALVIASESRALASGLRPMARILSYAAYAMHPHEFGIAPAGAVRRALERAALPLEQIDLIESNEAFAVQTLALTKEVGWDLERVNVNGGAIALGHPIGASGARILTTLLHEMERRCVRYGLATLCVGGGMGIAMVVERVEGKCGRTVNGFR
ncbi:MAG: acetyl-CoA C-acetyltransferase [Abditibacteriales bacterium]|nr:acetyl-CoA C-acetyltransferase [Abditibacteriales bacterium]MDW8367795.1 acetyl-CoA C-acetyltransferase [Abditibacteriales bacterium]